MVCFPILCDFESINFTRKIYWDIQSHLAVDKLHEKQTQAHFLRINHFWCYGGVFSKWSITFIEFSELREYRESEKSLRYELGSVKGSALLPVVLWLSGRVSVSYTGGPGFQPSNPPF